MVPRVFRAPSGPAAVCAGGRRPARESSALRAFGSARRLEARPGPVTAHRHRGSSLRYPPHRCDLNVARNSPSSISNIEFTSLGLQRFETFFKTDRVKLRATFWGRGPATAHVGAAARPSYALRSLRRPPHRRRLVADVWLGASARCPARTRLSASMSHVIPLRVFQMLN